MDAGSGRGSNSFLFRSQMVDDDDFNGGTTSSGQIGKLGWNASGTISQGAGTQDHPGQLFISTGAVQSTIARINLFGNVVFLMSQNHGNLWIFKPAQADAFTDIRFGCMQGWTGNPPTDGIYLERLGADTNYFFVCRSGGVQTGSRIDTGIAFSTNWATVQYDRTSSGVLFSMNYGTPVLVTANVPTVGGAFGCHIINGEAQAKTMNVDYTKFYVSGLVR